MKIKILGLVMVGLFLGLFLGVGNASSVFGDLLIPQITNGPMPVAIKMNQEQSEQPFASSYGKVDKSAGLEVRHLIISENLQRTFPEGQPPIYKDSIIEFLTEFDKIVNPQAPDYKLQLSVSANLANNIVEVEILNNGPATFARSSFSFPQADVQYIHDKLKDIETKREKGELTDDQVGEELLKVVYEKIFIPRQLAGTTVNTLPDGASPIVLNLYWNPLVSEGERDTYELFTDYKPTKENVEKYFSEIYFSVPVDFPFDKLAGTTFIKKLIARPPALGGDMYTIGLYDSANGKEIYQVKLKK